MNEIDKILQNTTKGFPETGIMISITSAMSGEAYNKLIELMMSIIEVEKFDNRNDKLWEEHLPNWFVNSSKNVSRDELITNSQLWDFGSWIDGITYRGWRWWSYRKLKDKTVILLETIDYPYNVDPFFFMLYKVGVDSSMTTVKEIYPDSNTLIKI